MAATTASLASDTQQRVGLYVLTLLVELLGAVARYYLVQLLFLPVALASWVTRAATIFAVQSPPPAGTPQAVADPAMLLGLQGAFATLLGWVHPLALFCAVFPLVFSVLTYLGLPGGALVTFYSLGARRPSRRERERITGALDELRQHVSDATWPKNIFVIDELVPRTASIGSTLYVSHALVVDSDENVSPYLTALLAHALGHHSSTDARLTLALRRLVLPPVFYLRSGVEQAAPSAVQLGQAMGRGGGCLVSGFAGLLALILSLAGGGVGVFLLSPLWQSYWRLRDYEADQFAARAGYADAMIAYLKQTQVFDVPVPYTGPAAPYTELRIDRLLPGGVVVGENERAENAARVRWVLMWCGAATALLVAWLGVQSVLNTWQYSVTNSSWALADYCLVGGCVPDGSVGNAYRSEGRTTIVRFADKTFSIYEGLAQGGQRTGRNVDGTFSYVDENTISMETDGGTGLNVPLDGTFDITKQDGKLILRASYGALVFVPESEFLGQAAQQAPTAAAPEEAGAQPTAVPGQAAQPGAESAPTIAAPAPNPTAVGLDLTGIEDLIGLWYSDGAETQLNLLEDGRYFVAARDGTSLEQGTYSRTGEKTLLLYRANGVQQEYTIMALTDTELTLGGPNNTIFRYQRP